jgi:hypothetical protein
MFIVNKIGAIEFGIFPIKYAKDITKTIYVTLFSFRLIFAEFRVDSEAC